MKIYLSVSLTDPLDGPLVFRLLNAFSHFDFIPVFEIADNFRSRELVSRLSNLAANSSF